jgi:hypothetical protein
MKTRLTLRAGQNGTKKLQRKYGDRLLAVRYRYDAVRRLRLKTVELIEEQLPWEVPITASATALRPVTIRLEPDEADLRNSIKAAGGFWLRERRLLQLPYCVVEAMGLQTRVVG